MKEETQGRQGSGVGHPGIPTSPIKTAGGSTHSEEEEQLKRSLGRIAGQQGKEKGEK